MQLPRLAAVPRALGHGQFRPGLHWRSLPKRYVLSVRAQASDQCGGRDQADGLRCRCLLAAGARASRTAEPRAINGVIGPTEKVSLPATRSEGFRLASARLSQQVSPPGFVSPLSNTS